MDLVTYAVLNKKIDAVGNVPDEKIAEAVNTYLNENPVAPGATAEQVAQIDKNVADIHELKSDLSALANAVVNALRHVAWEDTNGLAYVQEVADSIGQAVLVSITAVFNRDSAEAGTSASDLDITVTGHYDDGTSRNVYGWTIDGTVVVGQNTFNITYNGLTCTVSVTGVPAEVVIEITQATSDAQYKERNDITKVVVKNAVNISGQSFLDCASISEVIFEKVNEVYAYAFSRCTSLTKVTFKTRPGAAIVNTAFAGCTNLTDIYVPWAEGEVANAKWGADNATIHYNTVF